MNLAACFDLRARLLAGLLTTTLLIAGCGGSEPASDEPAGAGPVAEAPATPDGPTAPPDTGPIKPAEPATPKEADGLTRISALEGGALALQLPAGATQLARNEAAGGIVSEQWQVADEVIFQANLLGPVGKLRDFGSDAWLRNELDLWLRSKEGSLVDGPREVLELSGDNVQGVYIKVASDNPSPTAYHYAINGFFRVGDQVVSMGGLHNDDDGNADQVILDAIESAAWEGTGEAVPAGT